MENSKSSTKPMFNTMKNFMVKMGQTDQSVDNLQKDIWTLDQRADIMKEESFLFGQDVQILIKTEQEECQVQQKLPDYYHQTRKERKLLNESNCALQQNYGENVNKNNQQTQEQGERASQKQNLNNLLMMNKKQQLSKSQLGNNGGIFSCTNFLFCSHIPVPISQPHRSIQLAQFEQEASNLDIILFKNQNIMSKLQRFFTKSDYDHVGIIVKFPNSRRFILESSGKYGVALTDFNKFCHFISKKVVSDEGKFKKKNSFNENNKKNQPMQTGIAYRKLKKTSHNFKVKQLEEKVHIFVQKVIGKKYRFSPIYLLSQQYKKKEQTYFCSQLVAQCLKFCDINHFSRPCYSYLPRDFYGKDKADLEDIDVEQIKADNPQEGRDCLQGVYDNAKVLKFTRS